MVEKYAKLLVDYCLDLKEGEKFLITSTYLAEPLLQEVYKASLQKGALPIIFTEIQELDRILLDEGNEQQLSTPNQFYKEAIENFDAFLNIRAPFNLKDLQNTDPKKQKMLQKAKQDINKTYFKRIADGSLKRSLCQYPTIASAQEAGMSLKEYEAFVYNACFLYDDDPVAKWLEIREKQQKAVDLLNKKDKIRYKGPDFDVSFSVKGRTWINSDGRNNMPSGEVFTAPVEDSVNGTIRFSFPSIYMGREVEDIKLEVRNGEVVKWEATKGGEFLDEIFSIEGAKYFGEVAIGTNHGIQTFTKNILFDEKIGGTIHMAIGQSYIQTGGKNNSSIHWDMIADMKNGGEIYADDELIYRDGRFIF